MGDSTASGNRHANETPEQREKRLAYHREWMRQFRLKHPEKQREANARYAAKNGDKLKEAGRKRYAAKRDQIIRQVCEYSKKNREKINARNRRKRLADPDKYKALDRKTYLKYRERGKQLRAQRKPEFAAYMRHKRNTDPQFAVADRLRRRINQALRRSNAKKCGGLNETACKPTRSGPKPRVLVSMARATDPFSGIRASMPFAASDKRPSVSRSPTASCRPPCRAF